MDAFFPFHYMPTLSILIDMSKMNGTILISSIRAPFAIIEYYNARTSIFPYTKADAASAADVAAISFFVHLPVTRERFYRMQSQSGCVCVLLSGNCQSTECKYEC